MNPTHAISLVLALVLSAPLPLPVRGAGGDDAGRYVWDLPSLFPDDAAWAAERATIERKIGELARLRGTVCRDARHLADALDEIYDLRARASKMAIFGMLVRDVDTQSEVAQSRYDTSAALEIRVEAAVEFVEDEIRAAGADRLAKWLGEEPRLDRHRRRINRIVLEARHAPPGDAQEAVESMARWTRLSSDVFDELHEAKLGWPTVRDSSGSEVVVDQGSFTPLRRSADRGTRDRATSAYLGRLRALEEVFGLLLTRRVEADLAIARHRGFADGIEAIWSLRDGMPAGSARRVIDATRANVATLRRYVELRRRVFGFDRSSFTDLFVNPPGLDRTYTVAEAVELSVAAAAPLGADYQKRLRDYTTRPWMHLAPSPAKSGTYAIFPSAGGMPPYFIMSYNGSYRSARAFAGGLVVLKAFADIPRDRASDTRDDPGIYSNGVIYAGDLMFDDLMASRATDRRERLAALLYDLDLVWSHFFRWAVVSDFEARVQELVARGDTPTGARVSRLYLEVLREYYGPNVLVDDALAAEWMTLSVPFLSYEDQFWPPALAAGCLIVERVRAGDSKVRAFDQLLGRGDLDLTYQLLERIGIDMNSSEPYDAVMRRMNARMDEVERLLGP